MSNKKKQIAIRESAVSKRVVNPTAPKLRKEDNGEYTVEQTEIEETSPTLLSKVFGTEDLDSFNFLLNYLLPVLSETNDLDVQVEFINKITPIMQAINPKDELEGLLATQMIGIHALAMKQMVSCASDDRLDAVNLKINQITKMSRTFIAQMDALNKHRGKGQQKMTVKHVHVNEGGQAVIGNVEKGGG